MVNISKNGEGNLNKKSLCIAVVLVLAQIMLYASPDEEKYRASFRKWRSDKIMHYAMKVNYSSFTPVAGIWELEVKKGRVVSVRFKGKSEKRYLKMAERFTMESLYKTAEGSLEMDKKAPMIINAEYDSRTGYIKSIRRVNNPAYTGRVMRDAGYSIEVIEFTPLK